MFLKPLQGGGCPLNPFCYHRGQNNAKEEDRKVIQFWWKHWWARLKVSSAQISYAWSIPDIQCWWRCKQTHVSLSAILTGDKLKDPSTSPKWAQLYLMIGGIVRVSSNGSWGGSGHPRHRSKGRRARPVRTLHSGPAWGITAATSAASCRGPSAGLGSEHVKF